MGTLDHFTFRRLGTVDRTQQPSLSAPINALRIMLLQDQLSLDNVLLTNITRFAKFVVLLYTPYWFQCSSAKEAAFLDLQFYNKLCKYPDKEVSETASSALMRHTWYLTEELIPVALCSSNALTVDKCDLAQALYGIICQTGDLKRGLL